MVFAGSSPITTTSPSSKAHQKSGPFPQPALPGFNGHTTPSDSRHGRRLHDVEAATLTHGGSPPITRTTFPTCRAHYPGGSSGCSYRFLPRSCSLPQMAGGSASALTLSRPARASHALRPVGSLSRPRRPLSRGSSPSGYPAEPLVSYRINRQLSGWHLVWIIFVKEFLVAYFPSSVSLFDLTARFFVPTCALLKSARAEAVK